MTRGPRTWRRAVIAAILGMFLLFGGAGAAMAQSADDGVEGKTFVIGTDTTFAPYQGTRP